MEEPEATRADDAPEIAPAASAPDWSDVRGFQVIPSHGSEPPADPEAHAAALVKELDARAARFAQSIDDSIVLSSDGLIRWLGDPIARLVGGDDILKPRAVLLADEALTAESRAAADARLALWLVAHVRKVLGPLEALAEPGAVAEPVRDLAQRIAQALGVLDRERVRQQVKTLDQGARSALRKLGVRFGAFYIYVPALLKPAARTLCSQLWSLRRGVEPGSERLLAFAASGRTSFAAEAPLSPDAYRIAGFRLCGERVVRVDIVERLTDLIRAAIPDHMRPSGRPPAEGYGFVVTPQMTSLTGCAGEAFASILRSLGFETHRVKKSDYEAATRKAPTAPIAPAAPEAQALDASAEAPVGEAESSAEDSAREGEIAEPTAAEETASPAADEEPAAVEEAVAPVVAAEPAEVVAAPEPIAVAEASEPADPVAVESHAVAAEAEAPAPGAADAAVAETDAAVDPEAAEAPTAAAEAETPAEEEWIEIWRPAPRRRPQPPARPTAPAGEGEAAGRPQRHHRDQRRTFGRDRDAAPRVEAAATPATSAVAEGAPAAGEAAPTSEPRRESHFAGGRPNRGDGRRPHPFKGPRSEDGRGAEGGRANPPAAAAPKKEPRAQPVDMDSPFAKLLALKPLLERRDKRN